MDTILAPAPLALPAEVKRRTLTVDDYHQMARAGILAERERVELIEGQILEMALIGTDHFSNVNRINRILFLAIGDRGIISCQNPVRLSPISEPQPDFAVLKPRADEYRSGLPGPEDVFLLIETANSSLSYDRNIKAALYARHGITDYWIINLIDNVIEVHHTPKDGVYTATARPAADEQLTITSLPGVTIAVSDIMV
jgi:Uma2 family endonuclease